MPRISILFPVYNSIHDLPRAIDSLLNQTYPDFEIIAINDGSTDGSGEFLEKIAKNDNRIRVFHQENAGSLGKVLNKAAELAQGKYLARQDSDDASTPTRLENQIAYLDSNLDTGMCGSWTWFIDEQLGPLFSLEIPDNHSLLINYLEKGMNPFVHGSIMVRADLFRKINGYRGSYAEDFDLWLRLSEITRLGISERVGYYFWRSVNGISFGAHNRQSSLIKLYLKLRSERIESNKEITSWKNEYSKIISIPSSEANPSERDSSMHYSRAITLLKRNFYREAKEEFYLSSKGKSYYARRSRRNLSLFFFAPLLAVLYHIIELNEPFRYAHKIPPKIELDNFRKTNLF